MITTTRFFSIFAVFFLVSFTTVQSQSDLELDETNRLVAGAKQAARMNQLSAERVLYAADQAIEAAAVIVSSIENDRLIHSELKRLSEGIPGARAIIAIGPDGRLVHDSYKYPPLKVELADRSYFKEALSVSHMIIGRQEIGRTSGAAFIPLAKRVGQLTYVAIVSPFALVDVQSGCGDCWSLALQKSGTIITMFPPEAKVSAGLVDLAVEAKANIGVQVVRYNNSVIGVAWRKSEDFPLISVSVRGLPDTATVDVDIN